MQKKPYNQGFSLLIHTKLSMLLLEKTHTQLFAVTVSFRRNLLTVRQLYPRHLLDLRSHLVALVDHLLYFADASARISSDTVSTCGDRVLL